MACLVPIAYLLIFSAYPPHLDNDIYKRIGDLIRHELNLTPRNQDSDKQKARNQTIRLELEERKGQEMIKTK